MHQRPVPDQTLRMRGITYLSLLDHLLHPMDEAMLQHLEWSKTHADEGSKGGNMTCWDGAAISVDTESWDGISEPAEWGGPIFYSSQHASMRAGSRASPGIHYVRNPGLLHVERSEVKQGSVEDTSRAGTYRRRLTLLVRIAARLILSISVLSFTDSSRPNAGAVSTNSTPASFAAASHPEQIGLKPPRSLTQRTGKCSYTEGTRGGNASPGINAPGRRYQPLVPILRVHLDTQRDLRATGRQGDR